MSVVVRPPSGRAWLLLAIPLGLAVLLILVCRAFGPVQPLQNVVVERLTSNGRSAGISQENPLASSRVAEASVEIENSDVYVTLSSQRTSSISKYVQFGDINAELLADTRGGSTWQMPCSFSTLLFNYGPMTLNITAPQDPSAVVPEIYGLLKCG